MTQKKKRGTKRAFKIIILLLLGTKTCEALEIKEPLGVNRRPVILSRDPDPKPQRDLPQVLGTSRQEQNLCPRPLSSRTGSSSHLYCYNNGAVPF